MTKKEEVVDLKPKAEKVSDNDLQKIQSIIGRINQIYQELGRLEAAKHSKLHMLAGVQDELGVIQEELRKEYGTDNINVQDGTINYPKDGEADKKD